MALKLAILLIMTIDFSPAIFNPIHWHLEKYLNDPSIRYIMLQGGASAAKTYTVVQDTNKDTLANGTQTMVLRKFGSDIEDSIYSDFTGIISDWGLSSLFRSIKNRIHCKNGGYTRFRGLDDSEKIKGMARFKRVVMEELSQFHHEDFKQVRKRLRGKPGQQIIGIWNPIDENHWLKKEIYDKNTWEDLPKAIEGREYSELDKDSFIKINAEKNTIWIKTTYKDNYWIVGHPDGIHGFRDEHVIADFEFDRINDYPYYNVYALGNWGKLDSGAEFYKRFNPAANTAINAINPALPLSLSFDENVRPYLTCTIWQGQGLNLRQVDEITLEPPRNTLEITCREFNHRYADHKTRKIFLYGDATSRKEDTKLEKGYNFYELIKKYLSDWDIVDRVPPSNPPVVVRGMFLNEIFAGNIPEIGLSIGSNCPETVTDLKYVKEDMDGTKFKKKIKDPKTLVMYEEFGHCSDTVDYIVCEYFKTEFRAFQESGKTKKRVTFRTANKKAF